jgi:hypothetical protein
MKRILSTLLLSSAVISLIACHTRESGPFERAGERVDEIRDNAEEGKPLLHKKSGVEKAGEAIDEALTK